MKIQTCLKGVFSGCLLGMLWGCQVAEMANYQWHNADAQVHWLEHKGSTEVPFHVLNHHILLKATINGSEPLEFVLDSGAAATVITETAHTQKLNLPKDSTLTISGSGNGKDPQAFVIHDATIKTGALEIRDLAVIYAPTEAMPFDSYEETYFDGVLGADFFNCCLVEINYDRGVVVFRKDTPIHQGAIEQGGWQKLSMVVNGNTPFLLSKVKDGQGEKEVKVMLDTGSTGSLSLFTGNGDFVLPQNTYSARSSGISGDTINQVGRLASFEFGKYSFESLPVYFRTSGSNPQSGSDGVLGSQVMGRFNQVFDFKNEQYWIQPVKNTPKPVAADRSGLRLLPHSQGAIVKDIASETPAGRLNLKVGDIVTHINGKRVNADSFDAVVGLLRSDQHEQLVLCWQDEPEQQCQSLTLKDRLVGS